MKSTMIGLLIGISIAMVSAESEKALGYGSHRRCGPNEKLTNCGTACEPSCRDPNPSACTMQCIADVCQCAPGYVRDILGNCVRQWQCESQRPPNPGYPGNPDPVYPNPPNPDPYPPHPNVCPANEKFTKCGTACEPTCQNPGPSMCTMQCIPNVCQCAPGYVRDRMQNCVRQWQCESQRPPNPGYPSHPSPYPPQVCGANEEFRRCGSACEPSCRKPRQTMCTLQCLMDVCQCAHGYVRDRMQNCVREWQCESQSPLNPGYPGNPNPMPHPPYGPPHHPPQYPPTAPPNQYPPHTNPGYAGQAPPTHPDYPSLPRPYPVHTNTN